MYGSLDISTSGMVVARIRHEVASANIANATSVRDANQKLNPYQRRAAMVAPGDPSARNPFARELGVHVAEISLDRSPIQPTRYDPSHPDAFPSGPFKGYVAESNIDTTVEYVNSLEATRAYQANAVAAEATKQMIGVALRLIA